MKPANPMCVIICSKCTKIHLKHLEVKNFLQGQSPQLTARERGEEEEFGPLNNSDTVPPMAQKQIVHSMKPCPQSH